MRRREFSRAHSLFYAWLAHGEERRGGMFKRIATMFFTLALILSGPAAHAAPGDASLFMREETAAYAPCVETAVAVGETVYILLRSYDETLYTWTYSVYRYTPSQDAQVEKVCGNVCYTRLYPDLANARASQQGGMPPEEGFGYLFSDGEALYGFNTLTGSIARLTFAEGTMAREEVCAVNMQALCVQQDGYAYLMDFDAPVAMAGHAYFTAMDWAREEPTCRLFDISLTDGSVRVTALAERVKHLTPYQDGMLLGYAFAGWNEATQEAAPAALVALEADGGAITRLQEWPDERNMTHMAYHRASDTLYYAGSGMLWRMSALGQPQKAAYTSIGNATGMTLTDHGYAAVWNANGLEVRSLDPAYLPQKTLTLLNVWQQAAIRKFTQENPDVPLISSPEYLSAPELAQAIAAGDASVDIICCYTQEGFEALRDSGCCADLSHSQKLMDYVNTLYPAFRDVVLKDGKLYAIPVELTGSMLSYRPDKLMEAGLTPEDLPTTFAGLCEFITRWNNEWVHDESKAGLLPLGATQSNRAVVLELMFNAYLAYCDAKGEPVTFDTPEFNAMLMALDSMDASNLDLPANRTAQDDDAYNQPSASLLMDHELLSQAEGDYAAVPLPLSIAEGMDCAIPVYLHVMFLNPHCANLPEAIKFLECQVDTLDVSTRIRLCPGNNEPVEDPFYAKTIQELEESLASLREQLRTADGVQKQELEEIIGYHENALERSESLRWRYAPNTIAQYRAIGGFLFAQPANSLYSAGEGVLASLQELHELYVQRQIAREAYIAGLEALAQSGNRP